jgi:hypothetical protein
MSITFSEFENLTKRDVILDMHPIAETRRSRLEILIKKYGSTAALNTALAWPRTDPKLSQIRNANIRGKSGKPYQMGAAMARNIEGRLFLDNGWMDMPLSLAEQFGHEDPRAKIHELMVRMPDGKLETAYRVLSALIEPS